MANSRGTETGVTSMQLKDIMVPVIDCVGPDDLLRDASETMQALALDPLPVCEDGRVVGLIYRADLMTRVESEGLAVGSTRTRAVMSQDVVICRDDQQASDAV